MVPILIPNDMYNRRDIVLPIAHEARRMTGPSSSGKCLAFCFCFLSFVRTLSSRAFPSK